MTLTTSPAGVYGYRGFRRARLARNQPLEVINLITSLESRDKDKSRHSLQGAGSDDGDDEWRIRVPFAVVKTSRRLDEMALTRCSSGDVRDRLEGRL